MNILCEKLVTSTYTVPAHPTDTNPPHMHAAKISITIDARRIHTHTDASIINAYHKLTIKKRILD